MIKKVMRIMELSMLISQNTEHDVLCWYSGHVNGIDVYINHGGFKKCRCKEQLIQAMEYLTEDIADDVILRLEEVLRDNCQTFNTREQAADALKQAGYIDVGRGQWMGRQDCRTIINLPSGKWKISGAAIPKRV